MESKISETLLRTFVTFQVTYCDDTQVMRVNDTSPNDKMVKKKTKTKTKTKKAIKDETEQIPLEVNTPAKKTIDEVLTYLDASIISTWLEESNHKLQNIQHILQTPRQFVTFARFILTELPYTEYLQLIQLEHSILMDHLKYGFQSGFNDGFIDTCELEVCVVIDFLMVQDGERWMS